MDSLNFHSGLPCPTLLRPAGGAPLKRPVVRFRGSPPTGQAACGHLLPFWTSHAIRLCQEEEEDEDEDEAEEDEDEEEDVRGRASGRCEGVDIMAPVSRRAPGPRIESRSSQPRHRPTRRSRKETSLLCVRNFSSHVFH
jgi:hypothetical protein